LTAANETGSRRQLRNISLLLERRAALVVLDGEALDMGGGEREVGA
jgi:hypothetical protein